MSDMNNPLADAVKTMNEEISSGTNYLAEQMRKSKRDEEFEKELCKLINRHGMEQDSNTPDYILARHMMESLQSFRRNVSFRERWYGR